MENYKIVPSRPFLEFEMALPKKSVKHLITGKLKLLGLEGKNIKFMATSGCPRFQFVESDKLVGRGQIPSPKRCNLECYKLQLEPIYFPHILGIQGNGYPIKPFNVHLSEQVTRGDFLIHEDKNAPGSAGCIVITLREHWIEFEKAMAYLRNKKYEWIDLLVNYKLL